MEFSLDGAQDMSGLVGQANIKVIGVGGAGNNMVGWLYKKGIKGAEIIACNTDKQHLGIIDADRKFLIGKSVTRGLGCGGFPEKGAEAAKESVQELKESLKGADMTFVCAGMGGGTGTGAAPVVATNSLATANACCIGRFPAICTNLLLSITITVSETCLN
jgi:cell division protein FtsZ